MWRRLHSLGGLLSLLLLVVLAISGAGLAIVNLSTALAPEVQAAGGTNVAQLVGRVTRAVANVDKIERTASGAIVASFTDAAGVSQTAYVDVGTGRIIGTADSSGAFATWLKSFHRSLMLGDNGRWLSGAGAAMLVLLSISGVALLTARMGGLRKIFDRAKGAAPARLHTTLSRFAILPLVVTAVTGTYIVQIGRAHV